jgi:hypothetical protein
MEGEMLIPFSMIVLGTQLVIAVADGVPKFDIQRGCRVDSADAYDVNAGLNATIKRCVADEQQALSQLEAQWTQFQNSERSQCSQEASIGDTPSYVELLTCLQGAKLARQLPKQ